MILGRYDLQTPVYSLCKIFQMRKHRRNLKLAVEKQVSVEGNFRYIRDVDPPNVPTTDPAFRAKLLEVLMGHWGPPDPGEASERRGHLEAALRFFNGDLADGKLAHFCCRGVSGDFCCSDQNDSLKRAKALLNNLFFLGSGPDLNPQRWRKQVPGLAWWAAGLLLHGVMRLGYGAIHDVEIPATVETQAQLLQKLLGVRLKKGRAWVKSSLSAFNVAAVLQILITFEALVGTLFATAELSRSRPENEPAKRKRKRPREKNPPPLSGATTYNICRVVHAVVRLKSHLSKMLTDGASFVAVPFWPLGRSASEKFQVLRSMTLLALGQVHIRFSTRHGSFPYKLVPLLEASVSKESPECVAVLKEIMSCNDCCLEKSFSLPLQALLARTPGDCRCEMLLHIARQCLGRSQQRLASSCP